MESFISQLGRANLPANIALELAKVSRSSQYLVALFCACDPVAEKFSLVDCEDRFKSFDAHYHELKEHMLTAGAHQRIKICDMRFINDQLSRMHRLAEQMLKATRVMTHLLAVSTLESSSEKSVETRAPEVVVS